jgi:hypothetical protein
MDSMNEMRVLAGLEPLEESIGLSDAVIKKATHLTDANNHTEASILVAKALGYKHLAKKYQLVAGLHKLEGSMPSNLGRYRDSLDKEMESQAKKDLSGDEYKRMRAALIG